MKTISSHLKVCILSVNGRSTKVKKWLNERSNSDLQRQVSGLEKKSETKPHIKCPPCLVWKTPLADLISVKALFCALRTYPKTGINLRFSCWPLRRCRKLHETWVQQVATSTYFREICSRDNRGFFRRQFRESEVYVSHNSKKTLYLSPSAGRFLSEVFRGKSFLI